ncbi:IS30 family transposase [bacterium]|nr:MAG: IS30 family transposase [bacterium]
MGRQLGISHSTVVREVRRNSCKSGYQCDKAEKMAQKRSQKARMRPTRLGADMCQKIVDKLITTQSSPQQISGRLKKKGIFISHETIYQMIWSDKKAGGTLYLNLRRKAKKYNKRKGKTAERGLIPHRVDIEKRPAIVELKQRVGDFEVDTVIGAHHKGALLTLVDRATKFTLIRLIDDKSAQSATDAILRLLMPYKNHVFTITADNGKEFADHRTVSLNLPHCDIFFAKPYHSWERGLNEHTNGLIRQYLPKSTDFSTLTHQKIAVIQDKLNNRPRAALNYFTPSEAFYDQLSRS